MKILPHLEN